AHQRLVDVGVDGVKPELGADTGAVGVSGRCHDELVARPDGRGAPAAGERDAQGEPHDETRGEASDHDAARYPARRPREPRLALEPCRRPTAAPSSTASAPPPSPRASTARAWTG